MKGEFYKMDFRAWNIGTVDLTLEQEAAYLRLCHAMYDVGGPVPNSTRMLMGLFRCGNTKATVLLGALIAAGKIAVTSDDRLINHRVTEELANREKVSSARRIAGERGGSATRAPAERPSTDPRPTAERLPSDVEANGRKPLQNNNADEAIAPTLRSRGEEIRGDKKDPQEPNGSSPKGAKQSNRGHFLDEAWQPSEADWSFAIGELGSEQAAIREREKFRNFWFAKSGADGRKRDWSATWRNWTMRAAENGTGTRTPTLFSGQPARPQRGGTSFDAVVAGMADVAARRGLGPRGRQDGGGRAHAPDRGPRGDDPEIEDAQYTPAAGYRAAHH